MMGAGQSGPIAQAMVDMGGGKLDCKIAPCGAGLPESWKLSRLPVGCPRGSSIWGLLSLGSSGLRKGLPASARHWLSNPLTHFHLRDHVLRGPGQLGAQTVLRLACR